MTMTTMGVAPGALLSGMHDESIDNAQWLEGTLIRSYR